VRRSTAEDSSEIQPNAHEDLESWKSKLEKLRNSYFQIKTIDDYLKQLNQVYVNPL